MSRRNRRLGAAVSWLFAVPVVAAAQAAAPAGVPAFAEPGISPDHSEIAFASGGDIWTVHAAGGVARLLTAS